jgi:GT2 family glycosyltransferase
MKRDPEEPLLSVIVPTWNAADWTIRCLRALERNTVARLHLIWIDNGSDRSQHAAMREVVEGFDHDFEDHPAPLGFAGAVNRGLSHIRGSYTVFLNNDVEVFPGWDLDLRRAVDAAPGAAGPLILDAGVGWQTTRSHLWLDCPCRDDSTAGAERRNALAADLQRRWGGWAIDLPSHPASSVGYFRNLLAFFCVLFPTPVVRRLGELDTGFGAAYFEDDDYCMRLRREGFRLSLCPGASVHHEGGLTTRHLDDGDLLTRNAARFEQKWGEASDVRRERPESEASSSPLLWPLPRVGEVPSEDAVPIALWTPAPRTSTGANPVATAVSLYLPEPSETLEDQLGNLAHFLGDPLVVLQLGKGTIEPEVLRRWPKLRVNPARSGHPVPAHASNFQRLSAETAFDAFILGSGRELYFASGAARRLASFDAGFAHRPLRHRDDAASRAAFSDAGLSALRRHLGGVAAYGSPGDGMFFQRDLFAEIAPLVERFFRPSDVEAAAGCLPTMDGYFATTAAALTDSIGSTLIHTVALDRTVSTEDLEATAARCIDDRAPSIEAAPFGIGPVGPGHDDPVRQTLRQLRCLRTQHARRNQGA